MPPGGHLLKGPRPGWLRSLWKLPVLRHLREVELRGTTEKAQARPPGTSSQERRPRRGLHVRRQALGLPGKTGAPWLVLQGRSLTGQRREPTQAPSDPEVTAGRGQAVNRACCTVFVVKKEKKSHSPPSESVRLRVTRGDTHVWVHDTALSGHTEKALGHGSGHLGWPPWGHCGVCDVRGRRQTCLVLPLL